MCENIKCRLHDEERRNGTIRLSSAAMEELHNAFRQMDLLLQSRGMDPGVRALMELLRRLQRLRRMIRFSSNRITV
ncbi:MAG: hypothetical protein JXA11_10665 [Phycisphaerae bacterium]|nr:hypothetical protein [Phycisphaerae bacterium]